ncbi:MAG: efflux RND transporter periplasmic adaptor subunit [Candidatus Brocadiia bacterium]
MSLPQNNENSITSAASPPEESKSRMRLWVVLIILLIGAGVGTWLLWGDSGPDKTTLKIPTYRVSRSDLTVTVSAGGTIQAMESYDVTSKVEGNSQILYVIPEGTVLTEEDVKSGTVLVKLDSSSLEDKESQQSITVQDAEANLTQAKESYSIQEQENESNISQARLDVKFTRLELQRYLGKKLAAQVADEGMDFSEIGTTKELGGESKQRKRKMEAAVMLASEELSRAQDTLKWTRKLVEKGYVNRNEEVADELQVKRKQTELQKAQAELDLFLRYTLPKEAEQRYEDLRETGRELERVKARCRSQLAQANSMLRSQQSAYEVRQTRLKKIKDMIDNSVIRAQRPGLVAYASTINPRRYRNNPIQEGNSVREGQTIIGIPNLSTLGARVEINETEVKSVQVGQPATITVEAISDRTWEGKVARVSPMAKAEHRWLNPNVMVYDTEVALSEPPGQIKPGMSATTEIVVADLKDVIAIPVQAVQTRKGKRVCWIAEPTGLRLQEVETGHFTETKVEIVRGLGQGDQVLLAPPAPVPSDIKMATLPLLKEEKKAQKSSSNGPGDDTPSRKRTARSSDSSRRTRKQEPDEQDAEKPGENRNFSPEQMIAFLRKMDPKRREKAIKRIRENLSSMPEEQRRQVEQKLREMAESADGESR